MTCNRTDIIQLISYNKFKISLEIIVEILEIFNYTIEQS